MHAGVAVLSATAATAYGLAEPHVRVAIFALVTAVPVVTYLLAVGFRHLIDRGTWLTAAAGLGTLTLGTVLWPDWIPGHHFGSAEGSTTDLVMATAHLIFLCATATGLRRHGRADPGGLIDAALFGLCAVGPLWEWLIGPYLGPSATTLGMALLLSDVLVLAAVLGCLIRIGSTARGARGPLGYLVLTATLTLANDIVAVHTVNGGSVWTAQIMMLAYLTVAAPAVLPTAPLVTEPGPAPAGVRHPPLGWLGAALCVNPLIAAIQAIRADGPASAVLPIATIIVVPLVVLRLRLLSMQRAAAERTLAHQAHHDDLTGLYNRRHIVARIDQAMLALHRGDLAEVTVMLCDLDGFKPVNDRYGHQAGDLVLQAVALRLSAAVGRNGAVGRLGGDEFVIVQCDGEPLADRIAALIREPIEVTGGTVRIGASIGAATARTGDDADRETLIARADAAMYAVKARPATPAAAAA
ncbi:hypothetical protein Aph02nite_07890 [Actinoplanes philippinensis]|nr:hypothetical protein Aph02nite_07890 [Actinoplanes philippinensis]